MAPLTVVVVGILCGAVLFAPRRVALLALFAGIFFLSQRGGIQLGGLRLHPGRFLELVAIIRVLSRGELIFSTFGIVDRAVVITYCFVTLAFVLRTVSGGDTGEIAVATPLSKTGELIDFMSMYFAFRGLVQNLDDIRWVLRKCLPMLVIMVCCLTVERLTLWNPLTALGSASSVWIDDVDGGRVRCYGAFAHPALLGTFGAWMAVLYVALVVSPGNRMAGVLGVALSIAVVTFANSGGPLTSLMAGMLGWTCWLLRSRMRLVRTGIVLAFVLLALVMRQPIWYLPSKMSILFGGSGWHRSYLMDQAIAHFGQWWLVGMEAADTMSWFPYVARSGGSADITNLYVAFGIDGGIGALILLIWLLKVVFRRVGQGLRQLKLLERSGDDQLLMWALGCGVLTHAVNYISITYFDQTNAIWFFQLAAVAASAAGIELSAASRPAVEVKQHELSKRKFWPARGMPHIHAANARVNKR